jgi:putative SOS response-associated peptidase YedK
MHLVLLRGAQERWLDMREQVRGSTSLLLLTTITIRTFEVTLMNPSISTEITTGVRGLFLHR